MAFGARPGAMRTPGASFGGSQSGRVFSTVQTADGPTAALVDPVSVAPMGENMIARSTALRTQPVERMFKGAPKQWRVTNRARLGNVKVWNGTFDGERFPEGATDDKNTWLQPGESMFVPIEAGLHFVGNVFDPRAPEAIEVIERCGGFELETEASAPGKNAPVRVIGGPIGLPDFVVECIDGRGKIVSEPVAVYERYDKATRARRVRRKGHDPEVLAAETELLQQRIAEYTMEDMPLYGADGEVVSTIESRAEASLDGEADMRTIAVDDEPVAEDHSTLTLPRKARR